MLIDFQDFCFKFHVKDLYSNFHFDEQAYHNKNLTNMLIFDREYTMLKGSYKYICYWGSLPDLTLLSKYYEIDFEVFVKVGRQKGFFSDGKARWRVVGPVLPIPFFKKSVLRQVWLDFIKTKG